MKYQIVRMQKIKSSVSVARSLQHAFRDRETPNANKDLTPANDHMGAQTSKEAMALYKDRLPPKIRKNGVVAIEFLITASPEIMKELPEEAQDAYFQDSLKWLQDKHGVENVVYAGIHRDETTPHMYAYVVPLDGKGKLNCRSFYGERDALSKMQDDFHQKVGQRFGLDRGIKGSKAKHQDIKRYYSELNSAKKQDSKEFQAQDVVSKVLKKGFFTKIIEGNEEIADRLNKQIEPQAAVKLALTKEVKRREIAEVAAVAAQKNVARLSETATATRKKLVGISDKDLEELQLQKQLAKSQKKGVRR